MRDCPTVHSPSMPLIVHRISAQDCMSRQSCHYHKCHRCVFRGKAADWQPEGSVVASPNGPTHVGERAVPAKIVEIPRPTKAPATAKPAATKSASKPVAAARKGSKSKAAEAAG